MYAKLNASYTKLANDLNVLDMMNENLAEEHSWTGCDNLLLHIDVDPATLNTPEKRQDIYEDCLRKTPKGLRRATPYAFRKQLHPNLLLAKVEYWIRVMVYNA